MRELLVEMLEEESWIEIVGEVPHESEIRELVQKLRPTYWWLPPTSGQATGHL